MSASAATIRGGTRRARTSSVKSKSLALASPILSGQRGKDRPEHLARPEPAVQEDQRPTGPVRLEVQVDPIDLGVLSGARGVTCPIGGGHGVAPRVLARGVIPVQTPHPPETHRWSDGQVPPRVSLPGRVHPGCRTGRRHRPPYRRPGRPGDARGPPAAPCPGRAPPPPPRVAAGAGAPA